MWRKDKPCHNPATDNNADEENIALTNYCAANNNANEEMLDHTTACAAKKKKI